MQIERVVLVDTSLFGHLRLLGPNGCNLLEFILECHGDRTEGDVNELGLINYCNPALDEMQITDHGVSDQEAMEWYSDLDANEAATVRKLYDDGADFKLLIRAIRLKGREMVLSCDRRLLVAAARYDLSHRCFKAAITYTDEWLNGCILDNPELGTDRMDLDGRDPFFHFGCDRHCPRCDPGLHCSARKAC